MIARIWHGWTKPPNSDAYEALLKKEILPGIHRIPGFVGAELLRHNQPDETEFVTITYFRSLDDVKQFAGDDYEKAVVPEPARRLLDRFDARSVHYTHVFKVE